MPVSINNASRISVVTLTITYNPAVLRVRTVQDGTFMRQGGVTASFTPRIDAASGRVDIAVTRAGDQTGVSGAGLLAALIFDAVGPGEFGHCRQRRCEHAGGHAGAAHIQSGHGHGAVMRKRLAGQRGFTFVELLVVSTILLILASAVMPLARVTHAAAA